MKCIARACVLTLIFAPWFSLAQLSSSPPALMGQRSYHLYSVPGLMDGVVETFFACTNTTSSNIRVGIEVFAAPGGPAINDPSALSLEIPPDGSRLFATGAALWVGVDSTLGTGGAGASARILATAPKGIICTAFLADATSVPPASMAGLTIVKKTTQKGD